MSFSRLIYYYDNNFIGVGLEFYREILLHCFNVSFLQFNCSKVARKAERLNSE